MRYLCDPFGLSTFVNFATVHFVLSVPLCNKALNCTIGLVALKDLPDTPLCKTHQTLTPISFPPKRTPFFVTIESSAAHSQFSSSTTDSATPSPSLATMLLNQSSGDAAESRKAKAAPAKEDEDHISKLDIRVGIVRSVTTHPDAESLYIEQSKKR
jgi:tRNA-binding EMAP/Myf-like protein